MKLINHKVVAKLKPCFDRFDNYHRHYGTKSFTKAQFMRLKNITHKDKLWVALRLMPKNNIKLAIADIAESVLHVFETEYPNDSRPRQAIEAVRSGSVTSAIRIAAAAATTDATDAAAKAAAYAVDVATYTAAYAAAYASGAAYAASTGYTDRISGYSAAAISVMAASDRKRQERLIRKIILRYWK